MALGQFVFYGVSCNLTHIAAMEQGPLSVVGKVGRAIQACLCQYTGMRVGWHYTETLTWQQVCWLGRQVGRRMSLGPPGYTCQTSLGVLRLCLQTVHPLWTCRTLPSLSAAVPAAVPEAGADAQCWILGNRPQQRAQFFIVS